MPASQPPAGLAKFIKESLREFDLAALTDGLADRRMPESLRKRPSEDVLFLDLNIVFGPRSKESVSYVQHMFARGTLSTINAERVALESPEAQLFAVALPDVPDCGACCGGSPWCAHRNAAPRPRKRRAGWEVRVPWLAILV